MIRFHKSLIVGLAAALALAACNKAADKPAAPATAAVDFKATPLFPVSDAEKTALDAYIAKPDPAYGWKLEKTIPGDGYTAYVLALTSQSWRSDAEVDRSVWTHVLTIVKPTEVKSDKALLYIGGGANTDALPTKAADRDVRIAKATNSVVANLGMVPNQPLFFSDSRDVAREEDDIIAYSRVQYFKTKDPEWLVRLAMVKSGVKAMDAVSEFMASDAGGKISVKQFVVTGASKRGWTTWLVGAVDPRVIAIIPMVIDALNSEEITRHQYEAYGFFGPALDDYVRHGLFPHKVGTPEYQAVLKIEDPYNYLARQRLSIPKFEINASGDQFFLPDNSHLYYGKVQEEKRIRYVENSKHNLADTDAIDSLLAFYQSVITGGKRPGYSWTKAPDGTLTVTTTDKPKEVKLWQAHNDKGRDFRVDTIGKAYKSSMMQPQADGTYVAKIAKPKKGFTAFFVELTYDSGFSVPFNFTTEVSVVPDLLPAKWEAAAKQYKDTAHNADKPAEPRPPKKPAPATPPAPAPKG
jgi:PhoPQ-activated pathogenicity-related protein